jgi:hypothetical protein
MSAAAGEVSQESATRERWKVPLRKSVLSLWNADWGSRPLILGFRG